MKLYDYNPTLVGKRIQQFRKAKGYTQAGLAEIIEINTKNVSRLENGTMGLSLTTLVALCSALEVYADYILFGNKENNSHNTAMVLLSKLSQQKQIQNAAKNCLFFTVLDFFIFLFIFSL